MSATPSQSCVCRGPAAATLSMICLLPSMTVSSATGGLMPENTLVVANADSWASLAMANEYVSLRHIPPANVVYLPLGTLSDFEGIDINTFRDRVLGPVLKIIEGRDPSQRIDGVAWSSDIPYRVDVSSDMAGRTYPVHVTPLASLNGLTYLHRWVMKKDPAYLELDINHYYRPWSVNARKPTAPTPDEVASLQKTHALMKEKKYAEARELLVAIVKARPDWPEAAYNFACCLALEGKPEEAAGALHKAIDAGWWDRFHAEDDDDFVSIKDRSDFKEVLDMMKPPKFDLSPAIAFLSTVGWLPDGTVARPDPSNHTYLLSTMLAVTSGRGLSVPEALDNLRRSAAADGTRPDGTVYFMRNSDIRSRARAWTFDAAIADLRKRGFKAESQDGILPAAKPDVAGAVIGISDFNWPESKSVLLPGSIVEHLTSFGGIMHQDGGQTPFTEFLRAGAAGSSGTVCEPYAIHQKFPLPFIHSYYAQGCTLAEAFYQSVHGPYQLLIVGDPLCRPFARIPVIQAGALQDGETYSGRVRIKPSTIDKAQKMALFSLFVDGREIATCKPGRSITLATADFHDGWHDVVIQGLADSPVMTRGAMRFEVCFNNHKRNGSLEVTSVPVPLGAPIRLRASVPGAARIEVFHNSRVVASIAGSSGEAEVPSARLGLGTIHLQANGYDASSANAATYSCRPAAVTIQPQLSIPATPFTNSPAFTNGLLLTAEGRSPVVVKTLREGWKPFADAGLKAGEAFHLEGWCTLPAHDLCQVQARSNCGISIEVDGRPLTLSTNQEWNLVPLALDAGTHRLTVRGRVPAGSPFLDVRFGDKGVLVLDDRRFRCTPERTP